MTLRGFFRFPGKIFSHLDRQEWTANIFNTTLNSHSFSAVKHTPQIHTPNSSSVRFDNDAPNVVQHVNRLHPSDTSSCHLSVQPSSVFTFNSITSFYSSASPLCFDGLHQQKEASKPAENHLHMHSQVQPPALVLSGSCSR